MGQSKHADVKRDVREVGPHNVRKRERTCSGDTEPWVGAKHKGMGLNMVWEVGDEEGECGRLALFIE